jgi:type III secretion protein D
MKRLRILTGRHVGACLDLEPGRHALGRGAECDIVVSDWPQDDVCIVVGDDGSVALVAQQPPSPGGAAQEAGEADEPNVLIDFEPQTFGEVVLCVGSVDAPWPANLELLGAALQPGATLRRRIARVVRAKLQQRPLRVALGSVALAALALALTPLLLPAQTSSATPLGKASLQQVQLQLLQALHGAGAPALSVQVHKQEQSLEVTGLIDPADNVAKVRAAIEAVASPYKVMQHFSAADVVANDIRSAVGVAGAEVRHRGEGVFVFSAEVKDTAATRAAIERVARDLSPLVKSIEPKLVQLETAATELPILSAMTVGRLSIVQTRDGNKHIVMGAPASTLSVADALMTTVPGQ